MMAADEDAAAQVAATEPLISSALVDSMLVGSNTAISDVSNSEIHTRVYFARWWVLLVYGVYAMAQSYLWNLWGPIFQSSKVTTYSPYVV